MAKKQFKAESKRLLDLMINSIYTHKEIFLREIISNASDAIDKLCYLSLTDDKVGLDRGDFKIEITVDKDARTLTVSDNGIGMDKDELENNLGVIASSGSYKFRQEAEQKEDIDIIGQFGVGFYSAFMVADEITVVTKKYGAETAYRWQSSGADGYTVSECEKASVGTDVIMHLKADTDEEKYSEYLDGYRLYELVKKYSDYIRYPIRMLRPTRRVKDGSDPEKPEYEYVDEMTTVNSMVPLWQRPRGEVTDEEYEKFYQSIAHAFDKPQRVITASVEGAVTYKALLFIPSQRPMDFYSEGYEKGLQLYSAGVMIMDHCDALLPDYLRFVRGVVDSPDLSLNISRELLQHDRQLKVIGNSLEKKLRADLEKLLRDDREGYEKFYENFGRAIGFAGGSYGIGLLSRTEPLAVRSIPLPGREEARVLLMAEFPDYTVCITHLSLTPEDRLASLPIIREATDTCRKPVLLAGDFNTGNAAAVLAGLGGGFRILSDTTRMTFPSDNPAVRIDYILGRGLPTSATVAESAVDHTATASDHCPLWVTLVWKRGKQPGK